jgi:hypothetical protein
VKKILSSKAHAMPDSYVIITKVSQGFPTVMPMASFANIVIRPACSAIATITNKPIKNKRADQSISCIIFSKDILVMASNIAAPPIAITETSKCVMSCNKNKMMAPTSTIIDFSSSLYCASLWRLHLYA